MRVCTVEGKVETTITKHTYITTTIPAISAGQVGHPTGVGVIGFFIWDHFGRRCIGVITSPLLFYLHTSTSFAVLGLIAYWDGVLLWFGTVC